MAETDGIAGVYHGGDLSWAARRFGRPRADWIDLSTGINPWPYPVPALAPEAWTRLPDAAAEAALAAAAAASYGASGPDCVAAAPGSQALIQMLPRLRPRSRVAVVAPTYAEHARCWRAAGHDVAEVPAQDAAEGAADVIVLTNPNNPDGRRHAPDALDDLAGRLAARGGWLVVDEAFGDVAPALSLAPRTSRPGRIVLRSFGKFFGLAGIRLGFVLAAPATAAAVRAAFGAWAVSGPAIAVGTAALGDAAWIAATRARLAAAAAELRAALTGAGLHVIGGTDLFCLTTHPAAPALFDRLGRAGVFVRHWPEQPDWLRFGLPPGPDAMQRLAGALNPGDVQTPKPLCK
jgi:cobalamin biosynthetic protein CobC